MADIKVGQLAYDIIAKVDGTFHTNISKAETNVKDLGKTMDKTSEKSKGFGDSLKALATGLGLTYLIGKVVQFGKESVQAFANAQQSLIQFNNAQQNVAGTTKEQIADLNEYILALEKKTTIDDKSIRQASQIYAQDQLSIELQKKLLAGTIDLAVANSKTNGTEIDVGGTAKALGLAISTGDLGRLTKQNIAGITETQKALFKTGTDAERTAILMKILDENAKGAGESLGNSFQGKLNRAKDALEDVQVAIGKGLNVSLVLFSDLLNFSGDSLDVTKERSNILGSAFVKLTSVLALVLNFLNVVRLGALAFGQTLVGLAGVVIAGAQDMIGVWNKLRTAGVNVFKAISLAITGDFQGTTELLKNSFDFSDTFNRSKIAIDAMKISVGEYGDKIAKASDKTAESMIAIFESKQIYAQASAEIDKTTQAKDNLNKITTREIDATDKSSKATEKATSKLDEFNKTLVDTITKSKETSKELDENLSKSFKDFSDKIAENVTETRDKLAEIVVQAEAKKKELQDKILKGQGNGTDVTADQAELKKVQATLDARVGYEDRASKQIEIIRNKIKDAGLDPTLLNDSLINSQKSFEETLKAQKETALQDEFTQFENAQNNKLLKLTESFITETLLIKTKVDQQKAFETDLTTFITSENVKRTKDVELFASQSIAKYGQMASSLRSLISLQSQLGSVSNKSLPQFHDGGFVGASGGQVHAGEFVIPANIVAGNPALVAMLDKARNQTNNITINTQQTGGDLQSASEELLWRLGRV